MEQLNNVLPTALEENPVAAVNADNLKKNSPLLNKVREKFGVFAGLSLIFGCAFAFLFYKAGIGINYFIFSVVMVLLLMLTMKKLDIPIKKATSAYYAGAILLGLSSFLTSSIILQFLNTIGIMLLLDLSLLHQFHEDSRWDFLNFFGRMIGLFFLSIGAIGGPFMDGLNYFKNTKLLKNDKILNTLLGVIIAIPLLFIIVALLSSADLLFGSMTSSIYSFLFSSDIFYVVIMILFGFFACYCIICASVRRAGAGDEPKEWKKADPEIAVTVFSLLSLVYIIFCGIQVMYLFTNGLFVLPEEFTFAEYARRGFFELLTVTVINLVLMLIGTTFFKESKILRFMLSVMTAGTFIMIASATYRMLLYIGAYNLTFLRVFVLLFLLIDALVLGGVIVYVYNKKFPLFGYCVAVVSICYLVFSFARPDYFIASYHVNHEATLDTEDVEYLTRELSYDAAPVLLPVLSDKNSITDSNTSIRNGYDSNTVGVESSISEYYRGINASSNRRGIRDFNLSIHTAAKYAKQYMVK